ncbi:MAG TPA: hypothetical protein VFJ14_06115 [Nocardioidaceae bacterium]|nr:hypothetical protein [Nocardioidaceae bacterium]
MEQPFFWAALAATAVVGASARLAAGRPLWRGRSSVLRPWELVLAGVALLALVFHCAAMFFATWVGGVPFLTAPAASVRALGTASQLAYWLPAVVVVFAARRVWPPALSVLTGTLVGVGVTMFWSFDLTTHLGWIAAAVAVIVAISAGLVAPRPLPASSPTR